MDRLFYKLECYLKEQTSRKNFLNILLGGLSCFIANSSFLKFAFAKTGDSNGRKGKGVKGDYDLVLAAENDPFNNTVKAIEKMGGIERFVSKGDTVVVKPNIAWVYKCYCCKSEKTRRMLCRNSERHFQVCQRAGR